MNWKDAIEQVLQDAGEAMHYADIAEEVVEQSLRESVGATPSNTVNSVITTDLNANGKNSIFKKVGRGEYMLREIEVEDEEDVSESTTSAAPRKLIKAFGMFWRRKDVNWTSSPKLLGQQSIGADPIDLGQQRGIYLLHDRETTVYVGQSFERPIAKRLSEHTKDRHGGRWNRFSWFGILGVDEEGRIEDLDTSERVGLSQIVTGLEGVLIEAMEAPQNRRQGDGFKGIEYLQAEDPELVGSQKRKMAEKLIQQLIG